MTVIDGIPDEALVKVVGLGLQTRLKVGERFVVDGEELGRVVCVEGDFDLREVTAWLAPEILYWHLLLNPFPSLLRRFPRLKRNPPFTAQTFPA